MPLGTPSLQPNANAKIVEPAVPEIDGADDAMMNDGAVGGTNDVRVCVCVCVYTSAEPYTCLCSSALSLNAMEPMKG